MKRHAHHHDKAPAQEGKAKIHHAIQHADPGAAIHFCPRCAGPMQQRQVESEKNLHPVCSHCEYVFFLGPKLVACALPVLSAECQVILLRRGIEPFYGHWTMPGGYVNLGESASDAAVRETQEETGVQVEITKLLNLYSYSNTASAVVVYLARIVRGELRTTKEALEFGHFDAATIPWTKLAFQSTRDALKDWVQEQ